MMPKPFIITIVGPESSGKTTLARQLAAELGCPWVPEYAREYLEQRGGYYDESDLEMIAEGQMKVISEQLAVGSEQFSVSSYQSAVGSPQSAVLSRQSSVCSLQSAVFSWQSSVGSLQKCLEENAVLTFQREDYGEEHRPIVIIDSGMMGMRMWARIKYNMTIPVVEDALRKDMTSMYILCRPVLSWESDPLREAPKLLDRAWIYNQYLREIILLQSK